MFRDRSHEDSLSPSMSGVSESPRSMAGSEWASPDFSLRRTPSVNSPLSTGYGGGGGMHTPFADPRGPSAKTGSALKRVRSAGAPKLHERCQTRPGTRLAPSAALTSTPVYPSPTDTIQENSRNKRYLSEVRQHFFSRPFLPSSPPCWGRPAATHVHVNSPCALPLPV